MIGEQAIADEAFHERDLKARFLKQYLPWLGAANKRASTVHRSGTKNWGSAAESNANTNNEKIPVWHPTPLAWYLPQSGAYFLPPDGLHLRAQFRNASGIVGAMPVCRDTYLTCGGTYLGSFAHFVVVRCLACNTNIPITIAALRTSMI